MSSRLVFCFVLLHLFFFLGSYGSGAREFTTEEWRKLAISRNVNNQGQINEAREYMGKGQTDQIPHKEESDTWNLNERSIIQLPRTGGSWSVAGASQGHDFQHSAMTKPMPVSNRKANGDDTSQERLKEGAHSHPSTHHMTHVDPSVKVFFLMGDLKKGNKVSIYFPRRTLSTSPHLSKEEADAIPFSSKELERILHFFSFSEGSPQAQAIEDTLRQCEIEPIKGETKYCSTSLESMFDFARKILGTEAKIKVLSTSHLTKAADGLRIYTILNTPEEIVTPIMVACHTMPYPYAVFFCHHLEGKSRIYKVSLRSEQGDRVEAVAACHWDTTNWSPNHVSFKALGIKPGSSPICHFFPEDNLMLIPQFSKLAM